MVQSRGLVLFLLCLPGGARRSMRVDDSFRDAEQQSHTLASGLGVSADAREALVPGSMRQRLTHRPPVAMSEGKGFGGGEATRDPEPTVYDPNDPKGKQQAIHKAESFADYLARRKAEEAKAGDPSMRSGQPVMSVGQGFEDAAREEEYRQTDADSAADGPKILMPPTELLDVMPSDADSFAGYLGPYALLVLVALGLASAAFAFLVLGG